MARTCSSTPELMHALWYLSNFLFVANVLAASRLAAASLSVAFWSGCTTVTSSAAGIPGMNMSAGISDSNWGPAAWRHAISRWGFQDAL